MQIDNTSYTLKSRQAILKDMLGDGLYDKAVHFFEWLFQTKTTPEPLGLTKDDGKRYIIITRKGFSLWHAAYLCGLCGDFRVKEGLVISDRYWVKMTDEEQAKYTRGKHLFIIDDSGTTGHKAIEIQNSAMECASITVAMFTTLYGFDETPFEKFVTFDYVTIDTRREQNMKIMAALYKLAIPFTAESHVCHTMRFSRAQFDNWKKMDGSIKSKGWLYEPMCLQFSSAGVANNTFLLHAPPPTDEQANILFCGMRVCYRYLDECEDPNQEFVEVTLIPAVIFDVLDYKKAETFLFGLLDADDWLSGQLMCAEEKRKRMLVHRVISYLLSMPVRANFFKDVADDWPVEDQNGQMEMFHIHPALLNNMIRLSERVCQINASHGYPFSALSMDESTHKLIRNRLFDMQINDAEISIPTHAKSIDLLDEDLCSDREKGLDMETYLYKKANVRKEFLLICYGGQNRGVKSMDLVRRSLASFSSVSITVNGISYIFKTLVAGEGSIMALTKHYSFIWGLYRLCRSKRYKKGTVQAFMDFWNQQKALPKVTDNVAIICDRLTPFYWPTKQEILNSLQDDALVMAEQHADAFLLRDN